VQPASVRFDEEVLDKAFGSRVGDVGPFLLQQLGVLLASQRSDREYVRGFSCFVVVWPCAGADVPSAARLDSPESLCSAGWEKGCCWCRSTGHGDGYGALVVVRAWGHVGDTDVWRS
jgi:hypothetical protein